MTEENQLGVGLYSLVDNESNESIFQGTFEDLLAEVQERMPGPELPEIGQITRSPFDVRLKDLDINWALTQYASQAKSEEFFELKYLSDLPELPVYDFSSLEGDPYLDSIEGIDWSITNYSGSEEVLNTIKVSQVQEVRVDPYIKDLSGIEGTEFEDSPIITGIGSLNEAQIAAREAELGEPLTDIEKSEFREVAMPLRFSQVSKVTTASQAATIATIQESIPGLDDEEKKIIAMNLFNNLPGVYESWEDILNEDGTINMDTFTQAVIKGYNQAVNASQVGLAERYLDIFQVDGIDQMEAQEITQAFKAKVAELEAEGEEKQVNYTDLAALQEKINSTIRQTLGRGATDEEMRAFSEMYHKLERDAEPSIRQAGEAYETMRPDLQAQATQFAKTTSPAETEAAKIASAGSMMMQVLGIGRVR
jgi:hypothetical protein